MENKNTAVSSDSLSAEAALANKSFGISPTRYYRPEPRLGFTPYAELWHGRLAMLALFVAMVTVLFVA